MKEQRAEREWWCDSKDKDQAWWLMRLFCFVRWGWFQRASKIDLVTVLCLLCLLLFLFVVIFSSLRLCDKETRKSMEKQYEPSLVTEVGWLNKSERWKKEKRECGNQNINYSVGVWLEKNVKKRLLGIEMGQDLWRVVQSKEINKDIELQIRITETSRQAQMAKNGHKRADDKTELEMRKHWMFPPRRTKSRLPGISVESFHELRFPIATSSTWKWFLIWKTFWSEVLLGQRSRSDEVISIGWWLKLPKTAMSWWKSLKGSGVGHCYHSSPSRIGPIMQHFIEQPMLFSCCYANELWDESEI